MFIVNIKMHIILFIFNGGTFDFYPLTEELGSANDQFDNPYFESFSFFLQVQLPVAYF